MRNNLILTNDSGNLLVNYKNFLPCGSIVNYAGDTAPSGWFICDGRSISKDLYDDLFSVIGTKYGTPDSSLNFSLPDLQERVPIGKTSNTTLGAIGGNTDISLNVSQMPSHNHSGTVDASGAHTHIGTTDASGAHTHSITDPRHTHSQTTTNDDFNNSGGNPPSFSADGAGTRTWNNISTADTGISIDQSVSHTHGFTTASSGSHTHTFTTGSSGSGQTIDIRNKFIVLNYIIKY